MSSTEVGHNPLTAERLRVAASVGLDEMIPEKAVEWALGLMAQATTLDVVAQTSALTAITDLARDLLTASRGDDLDGGMVEEAAAALLVLVELAWSER